MPAMVTGIFGYPQGLSPQNSRVALTGNLSNGLIGCAALVLAFGGYAETPERADAAYLVPTQTAQTTQIPPECERLVDPIQRAKCVEEKSKGKK
jgi:hypothetical protein